MEFLYKTNDLLHSSLHMTERYAELLEACARTFSMERAELIVIPESREPALRFFAASGPSRTALASSLLTFAEQEMLNVLRDQLDRFGEPETVAGLLANAARALPETSTVVFAFGASRASRPNFLDTATVANS